MLARSICSWPISAWRLICSSGISGKLASSSSAEHKAASNFSISCLYLADSDSMLAISRSFSSISFSCNKSQARNEITAKDLYSIHAQNGGLTNSRREVSVCSNSSAKAASFLCDLTIASLVFLDGPAKCLVPVQSSLWCPHLAMRPKSRMIYLVGSEAVFRAFSVFVCLSTPSRSFCFASLSLACASHTLAHRFFALMSFTWELTNVWVLSGLTLSSQDIISSTSFRSRSFLRTLATSNSISCNSELTCSSSWRILSLA